MSGPLAYRVPMSSTRARIVAADGRRRAHVFLRADGSGAVFIGDSTVTADTGFELTPNAIIGPIGLWPKVDLWGVRKNGTSTVHVLVQPFGPGQGRTEF